MKAAPLVVLGVACTTAEQPCDTGDCGGTDETVVSGIDSYDGETTLEAWSWSCTDTAPSVYWYEVRTVGWSAGATLEITETGIDPPWSEIHTLPSVEYDSHRYWDRLYRKLDVLDGHNCYRNDVAGSDPGDMPCRDLQASDATTLYLCEPRVFASSLTWKLTVQNADDTDTLPCVAWGADPSIWPDCEVWQ